MSGPGNKKILLISYHFPPSIEVGGLRIANFAKYLPAYGWDTYVLTIKDRYLKEADLGRLDGIEVKRIFKTGKLPQISNAYLILKRALNSLLKKKPTSDHSDIAGILPDRVLSRSETIPLRLKRYIAAFLALPDGDRNWILPAAFRAALEIKRRKIVYILTSGPPHSTHLIGLLVKIISGVKWVADYRDPWMGGALFASKPLSVTCALSLKIEQWLERKVVQKADVVLTTTELLCSTFKEKYKNQFSYNKFLFIPNGLDKEVFMKIKCFKKYEKFTIAYTGDLYLARTPEPVFKAIRELIKEVKISPQNICLKLVGNCQYAKGYPMASIIKNYDLESVVEVLRPVPYLRALEVIKQSHLALLLAPHQPFCIPAKVYDYIGSGTRILTLAEAGATSDLINSTGVGEVFDPADVEGIKNFIYHSIRNSDSLIQNNSSHILNKFDRKSIIRNFADTLNRI